MSGPSAYHRPPCLPCPRRRRHLLTFHLPTATASQMASNGEKVAGLVWVLAFFLAFSGGCLVLAGLASMQSLCHNDG